MKRTHPSDKIFPLVLSADEHAEIRIAAAQARETMSQFIRERVLGTVKPCTAVDAAPTAFTPAPVAPSRPPERAEARSPETVPTHVRASDRPALPVDALLLDAFGGPPPRTE
jgi:hypothetical protein